MTAEHDAVVEAGARAVRGCRSWMTPEGVAKAALAAMVPLIVAPLRELAERGVGTDLTPTVMSDMGVMWWYDYVGGLDALWRSNLSAILDALPGGEQATTVRERIETNIEAARRDAAATDVFTSRCVEGLPSEPAPTVDREVEVWECGPHANAWQGHDARCRIVRTHGTDA